MKSLYTWVLICVSLYLSVAEGKLFVEDDEDIIRRSIIYDKKTPSVFYCPQERPQGMDNMLVKARPLAKLCEYQATELPEGYKSDCYGNVDETVWACKEKRRIMKRRYPPGMDVLEKYKPLTRAKRAEYYDMLHPKKFKKVTSSVSSSSSSSSFRSQVIIDMRGIRF